jgi:hypothetical protein
LQQPIKYKAIAAKLDDGAGSIRRRACRAVELDRFVAMVSRLNKFAIRMGCARAGFLRAPAGAQYAEGDVQSPAADSDVLRDGIQIERYRLRGDGQPGLWRIGWAR